MRSAGAHGNGSVSSETGADFAAVTQGEGKQIPTTRERRRGYRGRVRAALANADNRHHAACGALLAKTKKEIAAARRAQARGRDIPRRNPGLLENGAVRCNQIKLNARRRRLVPRRLHREPGEPVGVVIAVRELVEWTFEPFARVRKLCLEFRGYFGAYFVARLADAGAERSDDIFRLRAKLHLHASQRFCGDAPNRA